MILSDHYFSTLWNYEFQKSFNAIKDYDSPNIFRYSLSYGQQEYLTKGEEQPPSDHGIRTEMKMLEAQLGMEEEACEKTFNLSLFTGDEISIDKQFDDSNDSESRNKEEANDSTAEELKSNKEYKNSLKNRYADFDVGEQDTGVNLLELLDKIE